MAAKAFVLDLTDKLNSVSVGLELSNTLSLTIQTIVKGFILASSIFIGEWILESLTVSKSFQNTPIICANNVLVLFIKNK